MKIRHTSAVDQEIVEDGIRVKRLDAFPFALLYSIEDEEIVIAAAAHDNRKPGY